MALTPPPANPAAPGAAPSRLVRATFRSLADAAWVWMFGTFYPFLAAFRTWYDGTAAPELIALQTDVATKQGTATAAAATATTKAGEALTSANNAAASLADVTALYDLFSDQYLGAKAADPAVDNDGDPLTDGDFYVNTVSSTIRAYTVAGGWVQGIAGVAGVSSLNGQIGALVTKTLDGQSLLGAGALSTIGGATTATSAVDVLLTAASDRFQNIRMSAAGKSVYLADATTLASEGGPLHFVRNSGALQFALRDTAGGLVALLDPGTTIAVLLADNSTAAGVWYAGNASPNGAPLANCLAGLAVVVNAAASSFTHVAMLTATKAAIVYQVANAPWIVIVDASGLSTLTAGTPVQVATGGQSGALCALSNSRVLIAYRDPATGFLAGRIADIAGNVPTLGTANLNLNGGAITSTGSTVSLAPLSATKAVVAYCLTATGQLCAVVVDVTGITIAAGAVKAVGAAAATASVSATPLSATKALVVSIVSNTLAAYVLDIAGSVITNGTVQNVAASASLFGCGCVALSATKAIIAYNINTAGSGIWAVSVDVSGTTLALGVARAVDGLMAATSGADLRLAAVSDSAALLTYVLSSGSVVGVVYLTARGTSIDPGPILYNAVASAFPSVAVLASNRAIIAHAGASSFLNTQAIEVAQ